MALECVRLDVPVQVNCTVCCISSDPGCGSPVTSGVVTLAGLVQTDFSQAPNSSQGRPNGTTFGKYS